MASGKTLQSTIEISGVLSPSLQKAIESAVGKLEQMSKETLDSADAATRLAAEMDAQEDILKNLKRAYAGYVVSGDESSDTARELANKIQDVSTELNQNRGTLKDAERAVDALGDEMEESGEKAEKSSEGYTVLKNVIANLASEAISKAIEGFKELALEGDTALGKLEARTGASAKEMEGFEDVMYEVYNSNYGESLGDVSEKLSTVIQMTDDLDNASLAKVTKNAIALEDVFGFDVTESMRAVNSLMDQFGITSDQAFNLLVQGAQNGLNQNDDLLDTINEYSVQFKNAGYSADDMFNMLANGTETGTWSVDKLGDAVKEFNIRMSDGTANDYLEELGVDVDKVMKQFNKGGPEAQKAINTVMEAVMNCDDATLQYQTGVGLFGTMWEDLGSEAVASLMTTEGAIKGTNDAMSKMDEAAYGTLESSLSQLGRTLKAEVLQPLVEKLTPALKKFVDYLNANVGPAVDWLIKHLPEIGIALSAIGALIAHMKWAAIIGKVSSAMTKLVGVAKSLYAAFAGLSLPVVAVIAVVALLAAAFVNLWKNNEEFRNKITAIWNGIKEMFTEFGQTITDKLNELGFDFENFGEVVKAIWDGFCSFLGPIFTGTFQQISNALGLVLDVIVGIFDVFAGIFTGDWERVWEGVKEIFGGVWDFLTATFRNWGETLKGLADAVLGWFGTSWDEAWGAIKTFFVDTWNGIATFFSNIWTGIKTTASNAWNGIATFFTGAWNGIKNFFMGIWNGITSFLSSTWETIKNVVQFGILAIKSIISAAVQIITLPFRFIWENCKEYVLAAWNAIKSAVSTAINAVKNTITNVMNTIKTVFTTVWNAIVNFIRPILNAIKSAITAAWNAIKSAVTTALNAIKSVISSVWNAIKSAVTAAVNAVKNTVSNVWNAIKNTTSNVFNAVKAKVLSIWNGIKSGISNAINSAKSTVSNVVNGIKSAVSSAFNSVKSTVASVWNSIKEKIETPIKKAKDTVKSVIDSIKGFFSGLKLEFPKIKLPHFKVTGELSLNPPSVPKLSIDWYKDGGILTGPTIFGASGNSLLGGGEAGAEAVLPLSVLWDKMERLIRTVYNSVTMTEEPEGAGLTSKAGELLTLDNFSLGSLADGTNVVIYYDFSNFTWSPQIHTEGNSDDEDDLMAKLRAHEAEFFDWLNEFIKMREDAQYA